MRRYSEISIEKLRNILIIEICGMYLEVYNINE
jgi:hypothetical protein